MDAILQDCRYAFRSLRKSPGFTAVSALTLALGIGANTAIFTVVDETLFRYPPFAHANRIVQVSGVNRPGGSGGNNLSPAKILGWQNADVFERFEAYAPRTFEIAGDGEPEHVNSYLITTGLIAMLGIAPERGRAFTDADGRPGAERTIVISDGFWRRRFGARSDAIGKRLILNEEPYTIVGVMPEQFRLGGAQPLWAPFELRSHVNDSGVVSNFMGLGRLPAGVPIAAAQQRADALAAQLQESTPLARGWYVRLMPKLVAYVPDAVRTAMMVLLGAVSFVLLIACANIANLSLARATAREREMAVRAALGASRSRLLSQTLMESGIIAVLGGVVGVTFARWAIQAVLASVPLNLSFMTNVVEIDARVLIFASAVTAATALVFGLIPAWRASRPNLDQSLRGLRSRVSLARTPYLLVIAEVGLSLMLLVGAALMMRTFVHLYAIDPGFDPHDVITFNVSVPFRRYPTKPSQWAFTKAVADALSRWPSVAEVSMADGPPGHTGFSFGVPEAEGSTSLSTNVTMARNDVDGGFFALMRMPILSGRTFAPSDGDSGVIVSKALADYYWPDGSAVGRRFRPFDTARWDTIVGVVGNVEARMADRILKWQTYYPIGPPSAIAAAAPSSTAGFFNWHFVVRKMPNADLPLADLKARVFTVDQRAVVGGLERAEDVYADMFGAQRFALFLMAAFSVIAVLLAAVGLFAVLAQLVAQRTREIGVRIALGATPAQVVGSVIARGLALAAAGAAIGLAGAVASSRVLGSLLEGVSAHDPLTFVVTTALLIAIALVACWVPARRAARVDPMIALRAE